MSFEALARHLEREYGRRSGLAVAVATDFLHGGEPTFARVFDRHGTQKATLQRATKEPWAAFRDRAKSEAASTAGAACLVIGGLPDAVRGGDCMDNTFLSDEPPRGAISLDTTALHPSQIEALELIRNHRRVALVAGRRWGKSALLVALAVDTALCGRRVGIFAPTRTLMSPLLGEISHALRSVKGVTVNKMFGEIRTPGGAHCDFWSVDHTGRAGRGRKYHLVLIDEAAHDEGYLTDAFPAAIAPTLLDYAGSIVEASTPNGVSPENHFWQTAHLTELDFVTHHAPTSANPHLPAAEIARLRATMRPELANQELDALFVSLEGMSIFPLERLLVNGEPVPDDGPIDTIGVAIDSAAGEGGIEHDGTAAVIYGLRHPHVGQQGFAGGEVIILDWDVRSLALGGASAWLRHVHDLYRAWIPRARPRMGLDGFHIEKPAMGLRLLELAGEQRIPAAALQTDWVEVDKDGRALMVEPHVSAGRVKLSRTAYEKRMEFRGAVHNHLLAQVTGFRTFDKKSRETRGRSRRWVCLRGASVRRRRPDPALGRAQAGGVILAPVLLQTSLLTEFRYD
jgi:hypothetical protein